jgi:beta-glucanase (GH16 family)
MSSPLPSLPPSREEEKQELARLLSLPEIARSANLVRLLSFICERYFEGRRDEIRESTIAVQALGRKKEAFDSQADPIVRVTARTLRKRLQDYYRGEGRGHRVQLVLPTGQYVPCFVRGGADYDLPAAEETEEADVFDAGGSVASRRTPVVALALAVVAACLLSFWLGRRTGLREEAGPKSLEVWTAPSWSDEFDGAKGTPPDPSRWTFDLGNNDGWGNREQEVYCAPGSALPAPCDVDTPNAYQDGQGHLVLQALHTAGGWTSARLKTQSLREFLWGRIEARLKLPVGAGLWPAFWMLGTNVGSVGWPKSGSVSIVENVRQTASANGLGPTMVRSTIHGPGYFAWNGIWQNYTLRHGGRVDDGSFHSYGIIWSPNMLQFYVDDPSNVFCVRTASDVPSGGEWVFNHPFYLVLNLAVGGLWPGPPDEATPSPSQVLVDYVRLYKPSQVPGPKLSGAPLSVKAGRTVTTPVTLTSAVGSGRVYVSCSGAPESSSCSLSSAVVDFSNTGSETVTLTVATQSGFGSDALLAAPGSYTLAVTAVTISGDTSMTSVPLLIR